MVDEVKITIPNWKRTNPIKVDTSIIRLKLHLAKKIKECFERTDKTQKEFAKNVGITQPKLSKLLNKNYYQSISLDLMIKILLTLDVEIDITFEDSENIVRYLDSMNKGGAKP